VDEHRALAERGNGHSAALGTSLQQLTLLSRNNLDDLSGLQRSLDEHALASESLSEQLQEVNDRVIEHAGQAERLRALTGYLTQLTQVDGAASTGGGVPEPSFKTVSRQAAAGKSPKLAVVES
ncbi:MAG: hypothetical protein ABW049_07605, partial [Spongiibacteraceae bacterium]